MDRQTDKQTDGWMINRISMNIAQGKYRKGCCQHKKLDSSQQETRKLSRFKESEVRLCFQSKNSFI